jgi:hypothetical protein
MSPEQRAEILARIRGEKSKSLVIAGGVMTLKESVERTEFWINGRSKTTK